jgi:hypothetical protein
VRVASAGTAAATLTFGKRNKTIRHRIRSKGVLAIDEALDQHRQLRTERSPSYGRKLRTAGSHA